MERNLARFREEKRSRVHFTDVFYDVTQVLLITGKDGTLSVVSPQESGADSSANDTDSTDTTSGTLNRVHFLDAPNTAMNMLEGSITSAENAALDFSETDWGF